MTRVIGVHLLCSMSQEIAVKSHGNIHQNRHQMKRLCTGCPRRSGERRRRGSCLGIRGLLCPLHGVTFFRIQTIRLCLKILQYWAEPPPTRQFVVSHEINLVWLSRKSIIFPTISMESFEDSPDADHHLGYSVPRELVAKKWRSRLLRPRTHPFLCEPRNTCACPRSISSTPQRTSLK